MTSNTIITENSPTTNGQILSTKNKLNEFYSPSLNISRSSSFSSIHSSSSSSSCLSNKPNSDSSINKINSNSTLSSNHRKESTLKLPYPVLSDHRDPSSILILLQKETQTTSKKISNVIKQIEDYEQRLTLNMYTDNEKKTFKYERAKLKQQLDALKKHERRVNLQIDFITTKTEIKGLEDEQKQIENNQHSDESQQIKILLGKLKQKLDKMKIYMKTRNEQMKKISNTKQHLTTSNNNRKSSLSSSQKQQHFCSSSTKDLNRKRPPTSVDNCHSNKRLKPTVPIVRLTSRVTSHDSKKHSTQPPIVRFINKTTDSTITTINSASPTTPASSSTLSPPLIASTSRGDTNNIQNSLEQNEIPSVDDDDDDDDDNELNLELDMNELFNDDSCSQQTIQRVKAKRNDITCQLQVKQNT
ncbi:unnamed protein product [Rotaria sordida]|uniref:Uncharacterized protein n=1 Tax=Rotaria sordida TaxID=392033 RepID=A0A818P155_9BILA|nr:unnamed protein product [Rotaria sordida]CAF3613613.1 unnamed protein product [Rotaria sordida]